MWWLSWLPSAFYCTLNTHYRIGPHPHAKFHRCGFKMSAYSPKNHEKLYFFGINFPLKENSRGRQKKLNIDAQLQPTLPLCNNTIIVLKITLLHSVSVITNFVIPKRGKQTDRQTKTWHFFVYSRRATQDPHHTWHDDRGGPSHFCTPLTFLNRAVVSPLGAIENLWENAPTICKNAYNLGVCPSKATKLET